MEYFQISFVWRLTNVGRLHILVCMVNEPTWRQLK